MNDIYLRCIPLFKAALTDDWETAKLIIDNDENAATAKINIWEETPLHIAVGTNSSNRFVEQLVSWIADRDRMKLRIPNRPGNNSLHFAAKCGNATAARLLVEKDPEMPQIRNPLGNTALKLAAFFARKETLWYLLKVTKDVRGEDGTSPYSGVDGGDLITFTIDAGFYDVALYLVENYPNLTRERDWKGCTALQALAAKPKAFPSGNRGSFWQNIIYSCIPVNQECAFNYPIQGKSQPPRTSQERRNKGTWFGSVRVILALLFWRPLKYIAPFINHIHETKITHLQTRQLVKLICTQVMDYGKHDTVWVVFGAAISTATEYGVHELVEECLGCYAGVIWYRIGTEGLYLPLAAIKHRQEKVYNLIYQLSGHRVFVTTTTLSDIIEKENALHIAAKLAPSHRLNTVTGAALQMQRELQWFKEVEKIVEPASKEALNKEKKTPRMLFTDEHADLVVKGEQWMKDTASSSTVVAALIVTVAFAAAFTVPGGNDDNGTPLFLKENIFMLFAISDAVALFSSSTSLLMFLSILTSRYAEEDFLYALPKRMTIGLLSLFVSIAATMIAFSATLALVLRHEIAWIALPLGLIASVPITLFALLQFPLLVELVVSTYGQSLFHKQNNLLLH